jgi:prophage regulatory protein
MASSRAARAWQDVAVDTEPRFLTLKDAAAELAITEAMMRTLVRSGELPAIQIGPKRVWRIERAKLEAYIDERYDATRKAVETGEVAVDDDE